jgi:hypothetical protein
MTIAAGVVYIHLPLLQRQTACAARPSFDRHIRWNRVATVGEGAAVQVGFVGVIEKWNGDACLVI